MQPETRKCLSEAEIGAYLEGRLSSDGKESFEGHLVECKICRREFAAITRVIVRKDDFAEEAPAHLIKNAINLFPEKNSVVDVIVNLIKDSIKVLYCSQDINIFTPTPVPALRGEKGPRPEMVILKKSFEDIDVELDIEKAAGSLCNIRVAVDDIRKKTLMNTVRVELLSEERELASDLLEDGEAVLEDVGLGSYTIKIHKKGKILGEIALKIK
ncbi:MAG: hypothetical protein HZC49_02785 [Nitrospirae bacterium]|nr:hypothetical protein [Nitrospirota bacterium]